MPSKEALEKLDYRYQFGFHNYDVYIKSFKGSHLYILMIRDKIQDYYVSVQEEIHSKHELERVSMAYEELLKDITELEKDN